MQERRNEPLILIIDNLATDVAELTEALGADYHLKVTPDEEGAFEEIVSHGTPDLVLLGMTTSNTDPERFCRRLKAVAEGEPIPILFIIDQGEEETLAKRHAITAIDFLTRPIGPSVAGFRIRKLLLLRQGLEALAERSRAFEEASRMREEIEHITRHDLKGPLNGVIGFSELLADDDKLDQETRGIARRINASGYRMLDMINQSLDLHKMEAGSYQCEMAALDLWPTVRRVVEDRRSLILAKELKIALPPSGDPASGGGKPFMVLGEEPLCYSMLGNLLTNAFEASPTGGTVTITMERRRREACIAIHNAGAVPEPIRTRFFDKYITAGKDQGTGLGTYSARLMARTQGGEVELTSTDADGTTVTVRLRMP